MEDYEVLLPFSDTFRLLVACFIKSTLTLGTCSPLFFHQHHAFAPRATVDTLKNRGYWGSLYVKNSVETRHGQKVEPY